MCLGNVKRGFVANCNISPRPAMVEARNEDIGILALSKELQRDFRLGTP
jgi:hypothetical protein